MIVESVVKKLRYFCGDFQDYELLRAAWRQAAIGWFTQNVTQKSILVVLLLPEDN